MTLCVVEDGNLVDEKEVDPGRKCVIDRIWRAETEWIRCELRDSQRQIRGYINPLHRGIKKQTIRNWGDALKILESQFY